MGAGRCGASVHIVNRMAPGGIETLVLDLARGNDERARTVVLSLEGTADELISSWPVLAEIKERLIGFSAPAGRRFSIVPALRRTLRKLAPDRIFLHHIGPLLYGGLAARAASLRGCELIHVEHDAWHYDEYPNHLAILKWCERLVRPGHFAVSAPIAARLAQLLPGAHVTIVPPGIDTARFRMRDRRASRHELGLATDRRWIGSVGRLAVVKGHRYLIEALSLLPEDVSLALVGDGEERDVLAALARSEGLEARVRFLGHRDDTPVVYGALDIFCLPSLGEGLPRAVLEAQACGVPVVATRVGALPDAVCRPPGELCDAGDPAALARALTLVLAAPPDSDKVRRFVQDHYDFETTLARYQGTRDTGDGAQTA